MSLDMSRMVGIVPNMLLELVQHPLPLVDGASRRVALCLPRIEELRDGCSRCLGLRPRSTARGLPSRDGGQRGVRAVVAACALLKGVEQVHLEPEYPSLKFRSAARLDQQALAFEKLANVTGYRFASFAAFVCRLKNIKLAVAVLGITRGRLVVLKLPAIPETGQRDDLLWCEDYGTTCRLGKHRVHLCSLCRILSLRLRSVIGPETDPVFAT